MAGGQSELGLHLPRSDALKISQIDGRWGDAEIRGREVLGGWASLGGEGVSKKIAFLSDYIVISLVSLPSTDRSGDALGDT